MGTRAGHGCRSIRVTCGYTHGNTCRQCDPQIWFTCSCRSLRIQASIFLIVGNLQVPLCLSSFFHFFLAQCTWIRTTNTRWVQANRSELSGVWIYYQPDFVDVQHSTFNFGFNIPSSFVQLPPSAPPLLRGMWALITNINACQQQWLRPLNHTTITRVATPCPSPP